MLNITISKNATDSLVQVMGKSIFFHISGLNKNYGGKPNADDDEYGNRVWLVLDDNNAIQTSDKGMSLEEVWDYVNDCQELLDDSMKYPCGC